MKTMELDVDPNVALPADLFMAWSGVKLEMKATLRRGVGAVTPIDGPSIPVKFSEVWGYDRFGDAVYAAGKTDLEAIQNAVNGEWFKLGRSQTPSPNPFPMNREGEQE